MRFSFRRRLTLFFTFIVVIPLIAVAVVLFVLTASFESGKRETRLSQAQTAGQGLVVEFRERAQVAAQLIGEDTRLAAAIGDGDREAIQQRLDAAVEDARVVRALLRLDGPGTFDSGEAEAVAPARNRLEDVGGRPLGELTVSVLSVPDLIGLLDRTTQLDVLVGRGGRVVQSTLGELSRPFPPMDGGDEGEVSLDGVDYGYNAFTTAALQGPPLTVAVLLEEGAAGPSLAGSSLLVGVLLLAFLVMAVAFGGAVSRSLQREVERLLDAARRLGRGDFAIEVPTEGNDEFAALGSEFNAMARQLEVRLEELQLERARLQEAIRRVGEAFAGGLDRDRLLEIVVQTAVDGVGGECGRVRLRQGPDAPLTDVVKAGDVAAHEAALHAAEVAVLEAGWPAETQVGGGSALSHPLRKVDGGQAVLGMISVARRGRPFTAGEAELFNYLASQAAVSIENLDLHESIQRQAVTDELTGLFNHRRFQEVVASEVERTRRFGQEMGLIMLDIDNFKRVNDTYGHLQGDLVLREVARVLRESSREIDEPARYGGEEMAVALPQTDLEGAYLFAERVRRRIEALELPLLDGGGTLRVTASFGAASLSTSRDADKDALVAAADAALYRAKRSGKNRTVKAQVA
jgi:diguanylate cyclase (GGDEF)-like protein